VRLRQIAFAARELEPAVQTFEQLLGLAVAYRDPGVKLFGLENAVFPIGEDFLEIVSPVKPETTAGRYIARRGGDTGYMLIAQCDDAAAEHARIEALGVRSVWSWEDDGYHTWHFHPRDCGGFLLSVDSADDPDAWPPAHEDWRQHVRSDRALALAGVELESEDPAGLAKLWSRIVEHPVTRDGGTPVIRFENVPLRFVAAEGRGPGIAALTFRVRDRDTILEEARARGLLAPDASLRLLGTRIDLVEGPGAAS
jgi:hypothetical protein